MKLFSAHVSLKGHRQIIVSVYITKCEIPNYVVLQDKWQLM